MYKKKIAVRAMTAIAAGALLASNVMVAGATGSSVTPTEKAAEEITSELKENSVDKVENADVSDTPKDETEAGAEEELPQEESKANEDASEEESAADETQTEDDTDDVGETEGEPTEEAEETEADDETEEPTEVETAAPEESTGAEDESAAEETEAAVEESQTAVGANAASIALREAKANIGVKVTFKGAYRPGKTTTIVINGATQDAYEAAVDVYLKAAEKKGDIDLGKFAVDYGTLEEKDGKYYATVTVTAKEETPETTTVTINYYDPENKKQAGEVKVETVVDAEGKISQDVVNEKMPDGYTFVSSNYQVRDGYVYVEVKEAGETPEATTVKINYYDAENNKQAAEVEVETVVDAEGKISQDVVNEKMPDGYTFVSSNYQVRDGYVYVEVKEAGETPEATTVKINYYDAENNKQAAEVEVETVVDAEGKISQDVVNEKMPDGYTFVSSNYQVRDGYVYVEVKEAGETPEATTVKINYYDAENNKQAAEVEVETVVDAEGKISQDVVNEKMPDGYTLVSSDYQVRDGYVYVEVKKAATTTVKINYYDAENNEQAAEVEVETVVDAEGKISQDVVNEKMPDGYTLVSSDYQVRDGYVYVEVKKAATTTVKINYYDAENNKQAAEVEVETVVDAEGKISQDVVNEKMPDGYTLVSSDYQVRDGYVYVEVKKEDKPAVEKKDAVLTISYEDENHVQLKSEKISKNGEVGKSYTFTSADVTLTAPEGYELVTTSFMDTTVDFGASKTFVVTVKKTENGGNNNGGSNGGGSSSGGGGGSSSGVASGSSGTLTNGNWNAVDDGQKWEYNYTNGTKAKNGWYTLEWQDRLDWYYFDADGYLVSGWYTDANGVKYYLHPLHDGRFGYMYTGWNKIDGQWQHFNDNTEQGVYGAWDEGMPVPAELANL